MSKQPDSLKMVECPRGNYLKGIHDKDYLINIPGFQPSEDPSTFPCQADPEWTGESDRIFFKNPRPPQDDFRFSEIEKMVERREKEEERYAASLRLKSEQEDCFSEVFRNMPYGISRAKQEEAATQLAIAIIAVFKAFKE